MKDKNNVTGEIIYNHPLKKIFYFIISTGIIVFIVYLIMALK